MGRPLLGFALAGVQGALLVRLAQLTHLAWNPKQSAFVHFGRPAAALYQGFCAPPSCCWRSPVPDPGARAGQQNAPCAALASSRHGVLLALLARATGSRLGGPRYYQSQLVRFPVFDEGSEPDANLPLRLLQRLQLTGWGWLGLSLLLTWMALNHG